MRSSNITGTSHRASSARPEGGHFLVGPPQHFDTINIDILFNLPISRNGLAGTDAALYANASIENGSIRRNEYYIGSRPARSF